MEEIIAMELEVVRGGAGRNASWSLKSSTATSCFSFV
jgi:hypothetical protein